MKNDSEINLIHLFAEVDEPGQGDAFVEQVSRRIRFLRLAHRVLQVALAGIGIVILIFLTPWVIDLTGYVALQSNALAQGIVAMIVSPVGCVMGGAAWLFLFLQRRL